MSPRQTSRSLRLFFATDLHASDRCFRKFVAAAQFYDADLLVLGGDLAGKKLVALRRRLSGGYEVQEQIGPRFLATEQEASDYEKVLADTGTYTARLDDEHALTPTERNNLVETAAIARLEAWVAYADKRLRTTGMRIVVIAGNDDPISFDHVLRDSEVWLNADGRVVEVGNGLQIAGFGYSTPTPWNTPRELLDEQIDVRLGNILGAVDPNKELILNVHVPPYGSGLDTCPVLDDDLRPVMGAGGPLTAPVGSQAVRRLITQTQPLLGLHGHVHEARGTTRIGRTLCANPGSQYSQGRLLGFLAVVTGNKVKDWMLTEG